MPRTSKPVRDYPKENDDVGQKLHGAPQLNDSGLFLSKDNRRLDHNVAAANALGNEKEERSSLKDKLHLLEHTNLKKELDPMQLFVNVQDDCTLALKVSEAVTIRQLKDMLEQRGIRIPAKVLGLTYGGKPLKDDLTMKDYDIKHNATLLGHWWNGIVED